MVVDGVRAMGKMRTRKTTRAEEGGRKGKEKVDELTRVCDVVGWKKVEKGRYRDSRARR
jgi:hypothetical protein